VTTTKRCSRCRRELSLDNFNKKVNSEDGLQPYCITCSLVYRRVWGETGQKIREQIIFEAGGCENPDCCSSNYGERSILHEKNYLNFQLDHIDESLKIHKRETSNDFIYRNQEEFFSRVRPNLQVLCYQCHLIKSSLSLRFGNSVHQKMYGRKPPSQFIDPGYDLFNDVQRVDISVDEDGEIWECLITSQGFHEDGWFVQRDLDGFLVSYLELQDGEGKYFMYNKDGERIL